MNLLSLFSGIGAFEKALDNEGIKYNLVNYCEIDKYASRSYVAIHNVSEELNLIDVTKVDTSSLSDIDLITYGFPCQDISQAGNQQGFTDKNGERTRSGLFFEALRIIKDLKPKYAIAENVKALTSKKFKTEFETVLSSLNDAGYNNYYDVLNAKDYGIPQNRERVFIVSIRKDVDDGSFRFPAPQPLNIRLKDILEDNVDEKFYLKETKEFFIKNSLNMEAKGNGFRFAPHVKNHAEIAKTITTRAGGRMDDNFIMDNEINSSNFVFNSENVNKLNKDATERMTKQAYETMQDNECKAGDVINPFNKRVVNDGLCPTLTTRPEGFKTANLIVEHTQDFRIRKLTPLECWRLMGFSDEDFEKAKASGISNSQLYKQAGNSIVVTVLQGILKNLFKNKDI